MAVPVQTDACRVESLTGRHTLELILNMKGYRSLQPTTAVVVF